MKSFWIISWLLLFPSSLFAADASVDRYPSWGIAFTDPTGEWNAMVKDRQSLVGYWSSFDSTAKQTALIMVEGGKPVSATIDEDAKDFAKDHQGTLSPTTLDGEKAVLMTGSTWPKLDHPEIIIISRHRGYQYTIIGAGIPKHSTALQIEKIRASWKWIDFESPAKDADLGPAFPALGGLVTIRYPRLMRTYPVQDEKAKLDLGLYNLVRNRPDFAAIVQVAPKEPANDLAEIADVFLQRLTQAVKITGKPAWRKLQGPTPRLITTPFTAQTPDAKEPSKVMWALVQVNDRQFLLINFTLEAETPPEDEAFAKVADKMIESIKSTESK